jgi:hypothetical protein
MENPDGPGAPAMDRTWHWSMVDPRWLRSRDSPECELSGVVGSKSSTWEVQKGELTPGVLTGCSNGWWRRTDEARGVGSPAAVGFQWSRWFHGVKRGKGSQRGSRLTWGKGRGVDSVSFPLLGLDGGGSQRRARGQWRRLGWAEEGERPRVGRCWAARPERLGLVSVEMKEKRSGLSKDLGRIVNRLQKMLFKIIQGFWIQIKGFQIISKWIWTRAKLG